MEPSSTVETAEMKKLASMTGSGPIASGVQEGDLLWEPSEDQARRSNIAAYMSWLREARGKGFADYEDLWKWSVADLNGFWSSIWDYFRVRSRNGYSVALGDDRMPGAKWFPGAELNYAQHALAGQASRLAVMHMSEVRPLETVTYDDLRDQVARAAAGLRNVGVGPGDRVVSFMPNIIETLVAFLASASVGAVWSSVSPDFGVPSVLDRFRQIEPSVLFAVDGYSYGGSHFDRLEAVAEIRNGLPTLKKTVLLPYLRPDMATENIGSMVKWTDFLSDEEPLLFEAVPFDHPLWILYSSGTTGLPKAIVHGHGGILLEHLKAHSLHLDLGPEDRFFWFSTTGWMMWNFLVSGLLQGSTILLYDGNPMYPDIMNLWRFAGETRTTYFGTSAPYIEACMKAGIRPGKEVDLSALKAVGSTASPLSVEGFKWIYDEVKRDVLLGSASGGTDVCTAFVGSCPLLPVHAGEIQCRLTGAQVEAFNDRGQPMIDELGELVVTAAMPSMPLYFWNDPQSRRYVESYFEAFPGVWRHGDWIKVTRRGTCVIYGRSDSTIKRGGVRTGTSEFYRLVEGVPEVADSLVVDIDFPGAGSRLLLFLRLMDDVPETDDVARRVKEVIKKGLSPRHVPDEVHVVSDIPRTLNGKKLEVPIKRILSGAAPEDVVTFDAMSNPESITEFGELAAEIARSHAASDDQTAGR